MASSTVQVDPEALTGGVTEPLQDINEPTNGNPRAPQTANSSDENHGDPSDGLWSMYLTVAEKQDKEMTESWRGDTDGILVFTGLFSATVASFIIESLQNLSPDSSDTTNALLTQISQQLVNMSNGTPLTIVPAQNGQPFKPTASAVRVNVLWFLSLILSLTCALSATLMQQWIRRYQELTQRRGAFHKRGRMRAYIFDGINKFGMTRAVSTMPTLLHISVFLFLAGLVDFLFPIYPTVAYATLGCTVVFALPYVILTVLPNIYLNCPYATPLSVITWRVSQFSVIIYLQTILGIRKSFSKMRSLANRQASEFHRLQKWTETLEKQVKIRRQWFSQGIRRSVELCAYGADSTVVTNALVLTLEALDEDMEIEDFAARIPGFFKSSVVQDAASAVLPLMSHEPNTDPVFGSRLCELLKTCVPETPGLDENMRKKRLRVCLNCLWHFGRAYNQVGVSQPLPSYFPNTIIPEITLLVQTEEDAGACLIGRCFVALIMNKLVAKIDSRTDPISDAELECLSDILVTESHDVKLYFSKPGAVALANMICFMFDEDTLIPGPNTIPLDVLDVVQQTLDILSQALPAQESVEIQSMPRTLLEKYLKGLWYLGRAFNQLGSSVLLPSYFIAFSHAEITQPMLLFGDAHLIRRCVLELVINKLAVDINARTHPVYDADAELVCLSDMLGADYQDVTHLLSHPGTIQFERTISLMLYLDDNDMSLLDDVLDVVQQTFSIHSKALLARLDAETRPHLTDILIAVSEGISSPSPVTRSGVLGVFLENLWQFTRMLIQRGNLVPMPSYVYIAFTDPSILRRLLNDCSVPSRCIGALVVTKLAADINSRTVQVSSAELACLSAILGTDSQRMPDRQDVTHLLNHPGTIQFMTLVFLINVFPTNNIYDDTWSPSPNALDIIRQTFSILSQALPAQLGGEMGLDLTNALKEGSSYRVTELRSTVLGMILKNMWHFTRTYIEQGNSTPLPSYIYIAFTHQRVTDCILKKGDFAAHVIRRCVGALVVNKLAAEINSRKVPVSDVELAGLSAILGADGQQMPDRQHVTHLLSHPGTIQFMIMVFLIDDIYDRIWSPTSDILDVVRQTFSILSQALPAQLGEEMRVDLTDSLIDASQGSLDLYELHSTVLGMVLKNMWHFTRTYIEQGNSIPLPSYIYIAFTHQRVTDCILKKGDFAAHVIRSCVGALVVNKLAADISSRKAPVSDAELAGLSAILGTNSQQMPDSQHVTHLLSHPGSIQFVIMVFLINDIYDHIWSPTLDMLDVVRQTFSILSQALPAQLGEEMRLNLTDTLLDISQGSSYRVTELHSTVLGMVLKNMWYFTRAYIEQGNSVPLPSYIYIAFTHPGVTHCILEKGGPSALVIRRCVGALVVYKLAADIYSREVPVSDAELACLSTILDSESRDVRLCLTEPVTVDLVNAALLAFSHAGSLKSNDVSFDARYVLQQTLSILSQALPAQENTEPRPDQMVALSNISDDWFERTIVSRFHGFLKICAPGASPLMEDVRTACLRLFLKTLWHFGKAYHDTSDRLPLYFPLILASPDIIHQSENEQDPAVRLTGCFFGALIVSKLVDTLKSPVSRDGHDQDAELACISAILGPGYRYDLLTAHQLRTINFRRVLSLMLVEIDTLFTVKGWPEDILNTAQLTLYILADRLRDSRFIPSGLTSNEQRMLEGVYSEVKFAQQSYQQKYLTVERLDRLRHTLEFFLPSDRTSLVDQEFVREWEILARTFESVIH